MDIKELIEKAFAVGHTIGYGNTENHYKPEFERWWNEEKTQNAVKISVSGSLPFDEYHKFHKWMEEEGWYEAAEMEYDNHNDPNSCIRLDIKELYIEYKRRQ